MNKVSIGEVKAYLGVDGEEQNKLLAVFLTAAEHLCEKVLRCPITARTPEIVKTAILFIVWQLYFHRDEREFKASVLENTVAVMLSGIRKNKF
jgi:hypothetical protein